MRIPSISLEYVVVDVRTLVPGATPLSVSVAFMATESAEPGPGDWHVASWAVVNHDTYGVVCKIGPGSTVPLANGVWWPWVRIVTVDEDVQRPAADTLVIT